MKQRPIVAIIGRPNVGKSSLFNRLLRRRQAIVSPTSGTTRDRLYAVATVGDIQIDLVDTAGLTRELTEADFGHEMLEQVQLAVREADALIFVLDAKSGFTQEDHELAEIIRKSTTPTVVFINKADNPTLSVEAKLRDLGLGSTIIGSVAQRRGINELRDTLEGMFKDHDKGVDAPNEQSYPRVALVGRPNVGKSTLLNTLAGNERVIVSDIPGTTRDAIDTKITINGQTYIIVDTAGLRRRGKVGRGKQVERYSVLRTLRSIDQADIVVLLVDGTEGLTRGDAHIATYALEQKKPLITAINKSDLIDPSAFNYRRFPFLTKHPIIFISAKEKGAIGELIELIQSQLKGRPDR